jgi:hypothetical protein
VSLRLGAGYHNLIWIFAKDNTVSSGRDAAWLDEVVFAPAPPKILRQPFDKNVMPGVDVTIPAFVEGAPPLNFQWMKNGTNLAGANSMYLTLSKVTRLDSGTYSLRAWNDHGSVTSSNALLRVLTAQALSGPIRLPEGGITATSRVIGGRAPGTWEAQASSNLIDWVTFPGALTLTNGTLLLRDTNPAMMPLRFYRIVEP